MKSRSTPNETFVRSLCLAGLVAGCAGWHHCVAAEDFRFGDLTLSVPDGFTVEQAAAPPLVDRPVTIALDDEGGLYVADSSGSNEPLLRQQAAPKHRIVRLQDVDGDGVFDRRTVFADRLMMLQGTLWHRGSLYAAAPPVIWKLTDTDGDGVADDRTVWFDGKTLTNCGNDLHGPCLGRDGWFYWTKGAFAEQSHALPGRPAWTTRAAHVFRARPDGSGREVVMTGGMDNPVAVAFTAEGERLVSATFLEFPVGGRRDGVIHALYGGVYGKDHAVLDGHERTGDLLPALIHMGPAAPSGILVHSGFSFGSDYAGNLFVCNFNLRTVSRHVLTPDGGTFTTIDTPFLSGDSPDFHPTDCVEDADGSLLVVDTGGWFKLCCPTSQLEKPAALGAIYRIRRVGAPGAVDPRGAAIQWGRLSAAALAALVSDERPAVAARACDSLAQFGQLAVGPLRGLVTRHTSSVRARQTAVWVLAQLAGPAALEAARTALLDPSPQVRHVAAHVVGLHRDPDAVGPLAALLTGNDAGCARAAAEALGRIGTAAAVQAVIDACPTAQSLSLEHSLTYALIESGRVEPLLPALDVANGRVRRAALLALDQIALRLPAPILPRDRVVAMCRDNDARVRAAAWWVASQHPDWTESLAEEVRPQLERATIAPSEEAERIVGVLARLAGRSAVADAVAAACGGVSTAMTIRPAALAVMRASRPAATPASWIAAILAILNSDSHSQSTSAVKAEALQTLAALPLSTAQRVALRPSLLALAAHRDTPPHLCTLAVQVARPGDGDVPAPLVEKLIDMLGDDESVLAASPLDRSAASATLAAVRLGDADLVRIADSFERLSGNDMSLLLPLFTSHGGEPLTRAIRAIARSPRPPAIGRDLLAAAVAALPATEATSGQALLARIDVSQAGEREAYKRLLASLPVGDPARGHAVFTSSKAACTTCHAMAFIGGRIGPDLSKIGSIRTSRDLLEAIVLPSASFVRSYEPMNVLTEDGRAFSGIIREETATELILQTGASAIERISRASVETIEPGSVSLMPKGYDAILSPQELADVVAFLARAK